MRSHNAISEDRRGLWASIPRLDPGLVLTVLLPPDGSEQSILPGVRSVVDEFRDSCGTVRKWCPG